jgi:hypothetical protein
MSTVDGRFFFYTTKLFSFELHKYLLKIKDTKMFNLKQADVPISVDVNTVFQYGIFKFYISLFNWNVGV